MAAVIDNGAMDPTAAFAELGLIELRDTDLRTVLGVIADLSKRTIPGAGEVSFTLVRSGEARTTAATGDLAERLDEAQYEQGSGPCLDASRDGVTLSLPDTATETRWPGWAELAGRSGIGSFLSIGLPLEDTAVGALNVYAAEAGAFDGDAITLAETFSGYAAVALANAHLHEATVALAGQLQAAMESRIVIEQAKGVLMGDRGCTADEAFVLLTQLARAADRKLRDVATIVVGTAASPRA